MLENHWETILKEATDYQKQLGSVGVSAYYTEQKALADEASWKSVPLILLGTGLKITLLPSQRPQNCSVNSGVSLLL